MGLNQADGNAVALASEAPAELIRNALQILRATANPMLLADRGIVYHGAIVDDSGHRHDVLGDFDRLLTCALDLLEGQ